MGRWWGSSTLVLTAWVWMGCGAAGEPPRAPASGPEQKVAESAPSTPPATASQASSEDCEGWDVVPPEPPAASPVACAEVVEAPEDVAGLRVSRQLDAAGRLLLLERFSSTGERLVQERYAYDSAGRRVLGEQSGVNLTPQREQRSFDGCGRLAWREQATGSGEYQLVQTSHFTYGPERWLTREQTDAQGPGDAHTTSTTRTWRDAEERLVQREYEGREGERTFLRSERWAFDADGHLLEQAERVKDWGGDAWSSRAHNLYDGRGLPLRSEQWFNESLSTVTQREYDAEGQLLTETTTAQEQGVPGFRVRHAYDALGRHLEQAEEELSDSGPVEVRRWTWSYAAAGGWTEVHWERDSGADTWTRTYDAAGRLVAWDEQNFLSAVFRRGSREYGTSGELVRELATWSTAGASSTTETQHTYDAAGQRTRTVELVTQAQGGKEVRTERDVTYDAQGRPAREEEWRLEGEERVLQERRMYRYDCRPASP